MRILILSNLYPNPWQPHRATFNRQQFSALAAQHEVRLICPVSWTDQLRSAHRGSRERRVVRDGMIVEYPPYYFTPKVLRSWHGEFYLRSVRAAFERVVEEFKPQAVLAAWAYPDAWAALKLCRSAGLPVVVKVHGSDVLLLRNGARRRQTIQALTGADAVVAVSRQLGAKTCELGVSPRRMHVVPSGVDASLFSPGSPHSARVRLKVSSDQPLLLFVGNLVPVKGLPVLINACALLKERGLPFQCRLIGQGPMKRALARQIQKTGLGDRVQLLGPRPLEQLPDWYRAANLLVLPSRSEGIPNVILEAQACGTPVVASRVGGIPEILDDRWLFPAGDARALACAIELALSRPAAPSARPLTWTASAQQLAGVLFRAIEENKIEQSKRVAA